MRKLSAYFGDEMEKQEILSRVFGYPAFRPGQEALIDGVLGGRDVFGIMPTGGGKSMCYQIPALMLPGITLVISPLISLMRDQVLALKASGVPAAYINSTLSWPQLQAVYRNLRAGQYKIVYVAPERLDSDGFGDVVQDLRISFLAVDEAHCISQWGQDFRPSYLRIVQFIKNLPYRPVVGAFTATATAQVRKDVERILELKDPVRMVTGFDRPNLYFEVLRPESKDLELKRILAAKRGESGIIYCSTRKKVEAVCEALGDLGFAATRYHAGLEEKERTANQEDFLYDRKTIMVATNAFGMGIDKSNVRFVIHYNMPKSMEAYYQEAGRAGRDGAEADCILLYSGNDVHIAQFMIDNGSDNEEMDPAQKQRVRREDQKRLEAMAAYCKWDGCLRGYILEYFGQNHPEVCGNCGNCQEGLEKTDITREAQMILSCVKRVQDRLGHSVVLDVISKTLRGSRDKGICALGLQELTTYGLMKNRGMSEIRGMAGVLEGEGYLKTDGVDQTVTLGDGAGEVLYRGKQVFMITRKPPELLAFGLARREKAYDPDLFEALQQVRLELSRENRVHPTAIFSDTDLKDMARKRPGTMSEFKKVSGAGEIKARWYGQAFLECIRQYLEENQ